MKRAISHARCETAQAICYLQMPEGTWPAGWAKQVVADIKGEKLFAAIMDEGALQRMIQEDETCSLRLLQQKIVLMDVVFAFRRTFSDDAFRQAVDRVLTQFKEDGTLDVRWSGWRSWHMQSPHCPCKKWCTRKALQTNAHAPSQSARHASNAWLRCMQLER